MEAQFVPVGDMAKENIAKIAEGAFLTENVLIQIAIPTDEKLVSSFHKNKVSLFL